MCTNVHFPEDLSFEFLVPATTEAILPAVDSNDLGHRHCRSVSAPNKASGPTSWNFSPRASLKQALKEVEPLRLALLESFSSNACLQCVS
jgi:hypothetical protein